MTAAAPAEMTDRQLAARVWRTYLKRRWKGVTVALVCAAAVAVLSTLLAQMIEPAVNDLLGRHPKPGAIIMIPLTIIAYGIGRAMAQFLQAMLVNVIGHGLVGDIQQELFGRMMRADLARLRATHSGSFVSQVLYDAALIREAATSGVVNWTQSALIVGGCLVAMIERDPLLAAGVALVGPFAGQLMRRFSKRSKKAAHGAMAATSDLSTALMESLDGVRVVNMENREAYEVARVAAVIEARQKFIIKGANARAQAAPATELLTVFVTAGIFVYVGMRHNMNPGDFMAFFALLAMAGQNLRQLANLQTVFAEGMTAARRLFVALDVEPEIREAADARVMAAGDGEVRLEAVTFAYDEAGPILDGVTIEARRGEMVALVGPSGGGKSTVLSLIPRFYDATAGRVTVDGADVRDVTIASLRARIGFVTQEPFLFDDTIRANIAYARPEATDAEIEEAARRAAAHEFILQQPDGYATIVGEAATRLSGGQRQRIAIARAFLKNAPILLLDEATSALDTESEAQVQEALDRLMAGRTTIVIAHRLSTVKHADRIYVIERGQVVETGTHASLVRKRGLYARLARAQDLDSVPEETTA